VLEPHGHRLLTAAYVGARPGSQPAPARVPSQSSPGSPAARLIALAQHAAVYAPADLIAGAAIWLIALATMVLIFTRPSNTFYRQAARPPLTAAAG
jgi:hypothetical protein